MKCSLKILLITASMSVPILIMKDPKCCRKYLVLASLHTIIYICKTYLLYRMYYSVLGMKNRDLEHILGESQEAFKIC